MDYDDEAAVATCWSKGDNGGGEGELILFGGERTVNDENEEYNHFDYGTSANAVAGNYYGGGGGCVVFSIHLYRGDKKGNGIAKKSPNNIGNGSAKNPVASPTSMSTSTSKIHNYSHIPRYDIDRHDERMDSDEILESLSNNVRRVEYPYQELYNNKTKRSSVSKTYSSSSHTTMASSASATSFHSASSQKKVKPDFSHGIIVECMRIRGDTIQFHKDSKAIFASARGNSDGLDDYRSKRSMLYHSPLGFVRMRSMPKLKSNYYQIFEHDDDTSHEEIEESGDDDKVTKNLSPLLQKSLKRSPSELTHSTFSALERILDLLEKDRLDAQLLGVKSLSFLTDSFSSGLECSYMTSLCILGSKMRFSMNNRQTKNTVHRGYMSRDRGNSEVHTNTGWIAERLHQKVLNIAMGRFHALSKGANHGDDDDSEEFVDFSIPQGYNRSQSTRNSNNPGKISTTINASTSIESQYMSTIRGYIMHSLTNAITNLIKSCDNFPLLPKPTCSVFTTNQFIEKIAEDVVGATRPPMALLGTSHEAAHAIKLLRLIASYSEEGFCAVHCAHVGAGSPRIRKTPIMDLLEKAYHAGISSHYVLKAEANVARNTLKGHTSQGEF